jgi:uncharacterized membrane protein YadS
VGAAVVSSYLPGGAPVYQFLAATAKVGLTVTLYLIGSNISRSSLKEVGVGPLAQGVLLWLIVAGSALALIRTGVIAL